jgi:hypothetical protein
MLSNAFLKSTFRKAAGILFLDKVMQHFSCGDECLHEVTAFGEGRLMLIN